MLTKPDISDAVVLSVLNAFGLTIAETTFLPSGDANSAVFSVIADDGARFFLKLRCGDFDEIAVTVPAHLRSRGVLRVMAPIATSTNQLWIHAHGFDWMLYPLFEGKNGFESPLSRAQWIALGETMRLVHTAVLPPELARRVPNESYSPRNRAIVRALDTQIQTRPFDDPIATELVAFWESHRDEIRAVLERAGQLAHQLQERPLVLVLCHSDLHAGNVLLGPDDKLAIVDWDNPILAPKERDLMFVGGGVGGAWNDPRESEWFFSGYGPAQIDSVALAYYRYERIVVDIAEYGERIFDVKRSDRDRQLNLQKLTNQLFLPNNVVDIAHRSYSALPISSSA